MRGGSNSDRNYGDAETIEVKQGRNSEFFRRTYINFDLHDIDDVDAAVLRLYGTHSGSDVPVTLYATTSNWDEDSITWDSAPSIGTPIATVEMGPEDQWYEWDVSSYLEGMEGESVSFVLYDEAAENSTVRYSSREGANPPELKILQSN